MELRDNYQWRIANLYVLTFVVAAGLISVIPARPLWFGFITDRQVNLLLSMASGAAIHLITKRFVQAFDGYEPATPLQAKRANEQIKLSAMFSNAIATATVAVLVLSQLVNGGPPDNFRIVMGVVIAGMIHVGGRNLVGLLKAEKPEDYGSLTQPQ